MVLFYSIIAIIVVIGSIIYAVKAQIKEDARIKAEEDALKAKAYKHGIGVKYNKQGRIAGFHALQKRINAADAKLIMQQTLIDNPTAYLTVSETDVYRRAMALGLKVSLKTDGHISGYDGLITRVNNKERSEQQRLQKLEDKANKAANANNIDLM